MKTYTDKDEAQEAVVETFAASVDAQLNGDKDHGWGATDSLAVIDDMLAEFAEAYAGADETSVAIVEALKQGMGKVINPSVFRQKLESKGKLNKAVNRVKIMFGEF